MNHIGRAGNGSRRSLVKLTVCDSKDLFRTDPRTILKSTGLLMGQITVISGKTSS